MKKTENVKSSYVDINEIVSDWDSFMRSYIYKRAWDKNDVEDILQTVYVNILVSPILKSDNRHSLLKRMCGQAIKRHYDNPNRRSKFNACGLHLQNCGPITKKALGKMEEISDGLLRVDPYRDVSFYIKHFKRRVKNSDMSLYKKNIGLKIIEAELEWDETMTQKEKAAKLGLTYSQYRDQWRSIRKLLQDSLQRK